MPTQDRTFDQKAVDDLVSEARRLYRDRYDALAVAQVAAGLAERLRTLLPLCAGIADALADVTPGCRRLRAAVRSASDTLDCGPGNGATAALVHMQLLADSAHYLSNAVHQAAHSGSESRVQMFLGLGDGQQEGQR